MKLFLEKYDFGKKLNIDYYQYSKAKKENLKPPLMVHMVGFGEIGHLTQLPLPLKLQMRILTLNRNNEKM